jgi:hypothetical protein
MLKSQVGICTSLTRQEMLKSLSEVEFVSDVAIYSAHLIYNCSTTTTVHFQVRPLIHT